MGVTTGVTTGLPTGVMTGVATDDVYNQNDLLFEHFKDLLSNITLEKVFGH